MSVLRPKPKSSLKPEIIQGTNQNSKLIHTADLKRGKMLASEAPMGEHGNAKPERSK